MTAVSSVEHSVFSDISQPLAAVVHLGRNVGQKSLWTDGAMLTRGSISGDDLTGGPLVDVMLGYAGSDRMAGQDGDDILSGGAGDDVLSGDHGNDQLSGGDGNDRLLGGQGDDELIGGGGDDILAGGPGDDAMRGDAGGDTFVWFARDLPVLDSAADESEHFDSIEDFSLEDDRIHLRGLRSLDHDYRLSVHVDREGSTWLQLGYDSESGRSYQQNIVLTSLDASAGGTWSEQQMLQRLLDQGVVVLE